MKLCLVQCNAARQVRARVELDWPLLPRFGELLLLKDRNEGRERWYEVQAIVTPWPLGRFPVEVYAVEQTRARRALRRRPHLLAARDAGDPPPARALATAIGRTGDVIQVVDCASTTSQIVLRPTQSTHDRDVRHRRKRC